MAETGELREGVVRDAVVRSFARAVERPCARPSCGTPARATLTFRYGTREAWLERLAESDDPQAYDLCATHAARTRPPEGWELRDRRPEDERRPDVPHTTPVDLGSDRTVAVLAAALRSVPDPVSEDAVADDAEVDRAVAVALPDPRPSPDLEVAGITPVETPPRSPDEAVDPVLVPVEDASSPVLDLGLDPVATPRPPLAARERRDVVASGGTASDW